jgi:hypothetical protein
MSDSFRHRRDVLKEMHSMTKQLTAFALSAALGSMILTGSAQACHKPKCAKPVAACAPVAYAPAPVACAPKKACFKLPKFSMPKFCHKAPVATCATTVAYAAPAPSAQSWATPQH